MIDYIPYKVVVLGDRGVGKTSIINKYIKDEFDIDIEPTAAVFFSSKNIVNDGYKPFQLELWDIPGEEKMRELTKIFLKDAIVFIFVYDVTNEESFERLKNSWVNYRREYIEKQRENFSDKSK